MGNFSHSTLKSAHTFLSIKTVEETIQQLKQQEYESSKPLARYADDADLTEHLKGQIHPDDPMAEYFAKKAEKDKKKKNKHKKEKTKKKRSEQSVKRSFNMLNTIYVFFFDQVLLSEPGCFPDFFIRRSKGSPPLCV